MGFKKEENVTTISCSELQTFLECPHQWKLKYATPELSVPKSDNQYNLYGTAIHAGIQALYSKTFSEAEIIFKDLLLNLFTSIKIEHLYKSYEEIGLFFISEFSKSEWIKYEPKGIEYLLYEPLIKNSLFFKGFIDLWLYNDKTNLHYLLDLKTSKKGWTKAIRNSNLKQIQLLLYKNFFLKKENIGEPNKVICNFLLLNQDKRIIEILPVDTSQPRLEGAFNVLWSSINKMYCIPTTDYPKNISKCFFCEFKNDIENCNQITGKFKDLFNITADLNLI